MKYQDIATQIINLKNADLQLRDQLIQSRELDKGYHPEMEQLHNQNAALLNSIMDNIGYPTIDKVGEEASNAAWLIIQHAIGQPLFMKKCAQLLAQAVSEQQAHPQNLAYLTDRIAVFEDRPQLYGTSFDWDKEGVLSPNLFDDRAKVNQRRAAIGLNTLEEQTKIIRQQTQEENQYPPADFEKRKEEMDAWRRRVGWINNLA